MGGSCRIRGVEYETGRVGGVGWGLRGVLARRRNGGEEGAGGGAGCRWLHGI
jgi:hypothetical protein